MDNPENSALVTTIETLEALYGPIAPPSMIKEVDHIHAVYRPFIESAPFVVLASAGSDGLDASPRGDHSGFVHIEDSKTLICLTGAATTASTPCAISSATHASRCCSSSLAWARPCGSTEQRRYRFSPNCCRVLR
ncbi:Pyridoxamine 5'-phosphate oxidase family protein [Pseudomonas amygdali pv. mori]|uniref:Pyridoxamine 5'-phosphate oxidase family protein n=1 Tax=Pseudomonas amygdali pv. mori TaxID=34065 RepID=A0A0P9UYT0_PSEA0|nr:Pyridoxamine 5'-phosphate oxidase family protein [Pseudomonas amygdali pv. mori]